MMKKLLLTGIALFLVTGTAQARVWIPGSPEWNARYNCARQFQRARIQAGDSRWRRMIAMGRAGDARYVVRYTRDGQSFVRSSDRYCAARGQ